MMKKYFISQNSGFTLVELIISIAISGVILLGVFFSFTSILNLNDDNFNKIESFDELNNFSDKFDYYISTYKEVLKLENSNSIGYDSMSYIVLSDNTKQNGVIIGVFDSITNEVINSGSFFYSKYNLFFKNLDNTDLSAIESDSNNFIQNIDKNTIYVFKNLDLIEFDITKFNNDFLKINLGFTYKYYNKYYNILTDDLKKSRDFDYTSLSIIK